MLQYETGKLPRGTAIGGGRWSPHDPVTLVAHCRIGNSLPQLLAGPEVRHVLRGHVYLLARFRVAAHPRGPMVQAEAAESADLDPLPSLQRLSHRAVNRLHGSLGILLYQLRVSPRQQRDQLGLRHDCAPPCPNGSLRPASRNRMQTKAVLTFMTMGLSDLNSEGTCRGLQSGVA